jgi:hypothetical protein
MTNYRAQIAVACAAVTFHGPASFSWLGTRTPALPRAVRQALTPATARDYLRGSIQLRLYTSFYTTGGVAAAPAPEVPLRPGGVAPFVAQLAAANQGRGLAEPGWVVQDAADGRLGLRRGNLTLWAGPDDCWSADGRTVAPGVPVTLRFPKDLLGLSPGYYLALGDAPLPDGRTQPIVRLYWNLIAGGATPLIARATALLNQAGLPFHLKVLNDPRRFTRCDAGVLYLARRDLPAARDALAEIYAALQAQLKPAVPALTKCLAPGLGLAEDPGAESFGLQRCGLLAEGLLRADAAGAAVLDARVAAVEACFIAAGIDPAAPYLNPGSADDDPLDPLPIVRRRHARASAPHVSAKAADAGAGAEPEPSGARSAGEYLHTAVEIGHVIARSAIWHAERCTWLGAVARDPGVSRAGEQYATLGPELYDGTAGVGLVLAELAAAAGDRDLRRAALGALRQALARADTITAPTQLGLFTGWPGVSLAAVRAGRLLGDDELPTAGVALLARLPEGMAAAHEADLLSGSAGAIVALLALHRLLEAPALMDQAVRLGDDLLEQAVNEEYGCSWRSPALPRRRNLTGLAHGAAGIGYALLELWAAIGDARYRAAAERAFTYEQHWFNARLGNWPDFRAASARAARADRPAPAATAWCHGAPGIALTRLRAAALLDDDAYRAQADSALETTRRWVTGALHTATANYSLCHGLAGNAAILEAGRRQRGMPESSLDPLVAEVAQAGITRHAAHGHTWPCGTHGGVTPGLMLGLAGIARFYLGLADPRLPTLLLIEPEQLDSG